MKEIIAGLWIGTKEECNQDKISIDCTFSDMFLSTDLQSQLFMEKQTSIVQYIYQQLNNLQNVFIYLSNSHNKLETDQLIIIAFFIKYTNIKLPNLLALFQNKLQKPILQNYDNVFYQKILNQLVTLYRK